MCRDTSFLIQFKIKALKHLFEMVNCHLGGQKVVEKLCPIIRIASKLAFSGSKFYPSIQSFDYFIIFHIVRSNKRWQWSVKGNKTK